MADWYGSARSNYFRVKDINAFKGLCSRWGVSFMIKSENEPELVGFICETEFGGLPSYLNEEIGGTDEVIEYSFDDFLKELGGLLKEGEVAIMMESGTEKLRYITGYAVAVNSKGRIASVSLDDIYKKAKKLGSNITPVEY